ncbi:hypothetical protein IWW38_003752, partial [Coemansia aciculifera]
MPTFSQFATSEVQKSALVLQFVSQYESSSRKSASSSELRQLQEELERISARASARVLQLEQSQANLRAKLSEGGNDERAVVKRDRDVAKLEDSPATHGISADGSAVASTV